MLHTKKAFTVLLREPQALNMSCVWCFSPCKLQSERLFSAVAKKRVTFLGSMYAQYSGFRIRVKSGNCLKRSSFLIWSNPSRTAFWLSRFSKSLGIWMMTGVTVVIGVTVGIGVDINFKAQSKTGNISSVKWIFLRCAWNSGLARYSHIPMVAPKKKSAKAAREGNTFFVFSPCASIHYTRAFFMYQWQGPGWKVGGAPRPMTHCSQIFIKLRFENQPRNSSQSDQTPTLIKNFISVCHTSS